MTERSHLRTIPPSAARTARSFALRPVPQGARRHGGARRRRCPPRTARSSRCPTRARSSGISRTRPGSSRLSCSTPRLPAIVRSIRRSGSFSTRTTTRSATSTRGRSAGCISRPSLPRRRRLSRARRRGDAATAGAARCRRRRARRSDRARAPARAAAPGADPHRREAHAVVQPAAARLPPLWPLATAASRATRLRRPGSSSTAGWPRSATTATASPSTTRGRAIANFWRRSRSRRGRSRNGEYLAFIDDGGYRRPELWLSDGWDWRQRRRLGCAALLAARRRRVAHGSRCAACLPIDPRAPVCHVSFFEADAYARWAGARLPTEVEWEARGRAALPVDGTFRRGAARCIRWPSRRAAAGALAQMFGDVWEWTRSAYAPYPGLPPGGRRGRRVQRQVHVQPVRAARRLVRDAALAHPRDLPQFLPRRRALAVLRHPPRAGFEPARLTFDRSLERCLTGIGGADNSLRDRADGDDRQRFDADRKATGRQAPVATVCGTARRRDAAAGPACNRLRLRRRAENRRAARRDLVQGAPDKLPDALAKLDYDHFRDIRFKPDRSLWRSEGLPFELAFFHEGQYFKEPVKINELVGDVVREVRFNPDLFDYGANKIDPTQMRGLGFAGFRVHLRDQFAEVQGRGARVPRRQLFSRARQGPAVRFVGARSRRRHRRSPRARSFRVSSNSGSRRPAPGATELTILRAARLPAHDRRLPLRRSSPASTPSSTSRRGCSCAKTSASSASRR